MGVDAAHFVQELFLTKLQETPDYPGWLGNIFSRIIETPDNPKK
jgi:hypothetical protein